MPKRQSSDSENIAHDNGHAHTNGNGHGEKKAKLNGIPSTYHHNKLPPVDTRNEICPNILSCIGNTPLVQLNSIPQSYSVGTQLLAKCEFFNAGGSGTFHILHFTCMKNPRKHLMLHCMIESRFFYGLFQSRIASVSR